MFLGTVANGPDPEFGTYVGAGAFGLVFSAGFLRATRLRVELDDHGITAFGMFKTQSVLWAEFSDVAADYDGLHFARSDGSVVTAGSLGRPNWATWLGRRAAADDHIALIRREFARHGGRWRQED